MNAQRALIIAAAVVLTVPIGGFLHRYARERYYHLTASGQLGCGSADVQVTSGNIVHTVRTGLDTARLLGGRLDADELIKRFERRRAMVRAGPEIWRTHRTTRDDYELKLAANLLLKIKHPKALEIFVGLLDDPLFVRDAPEWLIELGDRRACPFLLESWKKRPQYPFVYVNAFEELPYEPAIPYIIDVFRMNIGDWDAEGLFKVLETISGDRLQHFRGRPLNDRDSVEVLKTGLRKWWSQRQSGNAA